MKLTTGVNGKKHFFSL